MNTQAAKDQFLINVLTEIKKLVALSGLVVETDGTVINYSNTALVELTTEIGQKLGYNTNEQTIFIKGDGFCYKVPVLNAETLLTEFTAACKIDWTKKRTQMVNWEFKIVNTFMSLGSTPKPIFMQYKPRELAMLFESLDEFNNDRDFLNVQANHEAAVNSLATYKASDEIKGEFVHLKAKIKAAENMVKLWAEYLDHWKQAQAIAEKTDYEPIKASNEQDRINQLANNNEAVKAISDSYKSSRYPHLYDISHRDIYDTFKNFGLEPVNDFDLFMFLTICNEIKTETQQQLIRDETGNVTGKREIAKYANSAHYIMQRQMELKDKTSAFNDKYRKKDGMFKSVSWNTQKIRESEQMRINELNSKIELCLKMEHRFKEFI